MRQNRTARRLLATLVIVAAAGGLAGLRPAHGNSPAIPIDPLQLYGSELSFDVLRNGETVGQHVVMFRKTADAVRVESRSDIEVRLLFLTAYSFRYHSVEDWRRGELAGLDATIDDDGEMLRVEARREGSTLRVRAGADEWQATSPLWPTTHWNIAQTEAPALLNTLTGNLNRVKVEDRGVESVMLRDGPIEARRFVYSGGLECESWYDAANRWVKLRFAAEDGSIVEYVCRNCGAGEIFAAPETSQAEAATDAIGRD